MSEEIKDPNQLDLFAGILFTPEQEKMIADYIERCKKDVEIAKSRVNTLELILVEAGFVEGKDFVNNFTKGTTTKEVQLGYSWQNNQFKAEVTVETCNGNIVLKGIKHVNGKIEKTLFYVDMDKGKLQCSSIQDQYRYIKPATLLEKFRQHNELQKIYCENYIKRNNVKDYTIEKYQKLYPNATVTVVNEYTRNSGYFDTIQVKFPSCSYIQFYIPSEIDREQVYKKHDAEFVDLTTEEVLEKFNNQEALK